MSCAACFTISLLSREPKEYSTKKLRSSSRSGVSTERSDNDTFPKHSSLSPTSQTIVASFRLSSAVSRFSFKHSRQLLCPSDLHLRYRIEIAVDFGKCAEFP